METLKLYWEKVKAFFLVQYFGIALIWLVLGGFLVAWALYKYVFKEKSGW